MQANQTSVIWTIVVCSLLLLVIGLFVASGFNNKLKSIGDYPTAAEIAALVVIPEIEYPEYTGDYVLSKSDYESTLIEKEAEKLALEALESRDFKKAVFSALNLYYNDTENGSYEGCLLVNATIDCPVKSYKDITDVKIRDSDVNGNEVDFDLKIYYFVDGDDDENFRAKLEEFTITVKNLEVEDDFEDAEVDDSYLGEIIVEKVY